jgi:hypothetical protein
MKGFVKDRQKNVKIDRELCYQAQTVAAKLPK